MLGLCLCNSTSCCTDWGICYVVSGQMYRLMQMMMEPVVESQCLEVQCPEGWSQGGALVCFTVDSTITLLGHLPTSGQSGQWVFTGGPFSQGANWPHRRSACSGWG